jgi:hypothetical protein
MFDISTSTLKIAAERKYGASVLVSEPYFVDHEIVRVGVTVDDMSFGANFYYKLGEFS